ncbi:RNA-binding protein 48 isoform X2 [Eucyclogobius newberryi]|uniref:RNA-binding protein 48 isoform X2 n=1 Tax=Eucyclogobius newberryi TaxID=166745 RepID=UPI003B59CEB0
MAAPVNNKPSCWKSPEVFKHHEQRKICISRPNYREGRKAKAVKVYTINLESCYVMVQGVPAIGVMHELIQRCALYGTVEEYRPLDEYPAEEFTEVYLVKFQRLVSARAAKRHMDEKSFYGGVLHVCYVPEYETVEDTRLKLQDRKNYIMKTLHHIEKRQMQHATPETTTPKAILSSSEATLSKPCTTVTDVTEDHSSHQNSTFPLLPPPPREYPYTGRHHRSLLTEDRMGTLHNAFVDKGRGCRAAARSNVRAVSGTAALPYSLMANLNPNSNPDPNLNPARSKTLRSNSATVSGAAAQNNMAVSAARRSSVDTPVDKIHKPELSMSSPVTPSDTCRDQHMPAQPPVRFLPRTTQIETRKRLAEDETEQSLEDVTSEGFIGPKLPEQPKLDMEDESLNRTVKMIRNTLKQVESIAEVKPVVKKVKQRRRI